MLDATANLGIVLAVLVVAMAILVAVTYPKKAYRVCSAANKNANGSVGPNGSKECKTCLTPNQRINSQLEQLLSAGGTDLNSAIPSAESQFTAIGASFLPASAQAASQPQFTAVDAGIYAQTLPVAPTLPSVQAPAPTQAPQAQVQVQQAFGGQSGSSIVKRQAADDFTISSILPQSFRPETVAVAQKTDNAGQLMTMFAPNREKMFKSTTQVGNNRMAILNGRSARSRIVGQGSLLRPAPPISRCAGQEPTFLDSDLRHYALAANTPPIVAPECTIAG